MTLDEQTLQRLFSGDSQLAYLLETILNQVLNAQVTEQVQAERYERTAERQGYRNGYKPRQLTTRVGTLTLRVPQMREGTLSTELFARYQRSEQALLPTLMEMVVNAIGLQFQGATWQRCQTHLSANICNVAPKALQDELHQRLRALFEAPDEETARLLLTKFTTDFEGRAPTAVATLERGFEDAIAVLALPAAYRTRLRTTNSVEWLNEEIRRRERVIRIFPARESVIRLLGAVLMEQDEAWTTGHRYFDMATYWHWRAGRDCHDQAHDWSQLDGQPDGGDGGRST